MQPTDFATKKEVRRKEGPQILLVNSAFFDLKKATLLLDTDDV